MSALNISTTEMHTGGEPVRILGSEMLQIHGNTILEKRRYVRDNLDFVRKLVAYEPRGHVDMFGVIVVPADIPEAAFACVFLNNEGYATMCGHVIISLGRYAIDKGLVTSPTAPETRVVVQCPCGPVETFVEYKDGKTGRVRFNGVPAFVFSTDVSADVPGYGLLTVDIAYGGAFYAIVSAENLGLDVRRSAIADIREAAGKITDVLRDSVQLTHHDNDDLAFLSGTILTDGKDGAEESANICVFADRQVDRSPCGSGITARVALQFARGQIKIDQQRAFVGPVGGKFKARAARQTKCGPHDAVIVEVSGKGYYTGTCAFTLEDDDDIGKGFLLR